LLLHSHGRTTGFLENPVPNPDGRGQTTNLGVRSSNLFGRAS
jgi:hypothetical protein